MKDTYSDLGVVAALAPQVLSASNTGATPIDLQGFNSALVIINTGAIAGDGDFTAKLQHSDTTTGGDFVDVTVSDLLGAFPATLAADSVYKVGYKGAKRYLRTVVTKNSGTSIAAGIVIARGHPHDAPVA
jgi:hypothetical protein